MTAATEKLALAILVGCEAGATEASLTALGITRRTLDKLVAAGKITTRDVTMHKPKGLVVTWFHHAEKRAPP
jgi:hypothetical protein